MTRLERQAPQRVNASERRRCGRSWLAAAAGAVLAVVAQTPPAIAAPVSTDHLGLELVGNLEVPAGKSLEQDGAVLIVHDTLAHLGHATVTDLQRHLAARGMPSLAITLSLGLDKRATPYDCALEHDHRHSDAPEEIAAWVEWLKARKVRSVVLAGHGRGGAQVALLAARGAADPVTSGLVLAAPLLNEPAEIAAAYDAAAGQALDPLLASAHRQVDDGEGDGFLDVPLFLHCRNVRVTAEAFLDYYDTSPETTTLALLRRTALPTVIVAPAGDELAATLAARIAAAGLPREITLTTIEGADRSFGGPAGERLAAVIVEFAGKLPRR